MAKAISDRIFSSIGGFYSPNDKTRHAIVQTTEGKVFEIFFDSNGKGQSYLACFDSVFAMDAFFSTNDNTSHVIVATPNGDISEIYYEQAGVFFSAPPLANFDAIVAISGFYTPDDNVSHVIVATADGNITEVYYSSEPAPRISEPPLAQFQNVVSISAFYTPDDKTRHVIVATADGNVTEVYCSSELAPRISEPPLVKMPDIVDISAFYTPDDNYRHVIVATADGNLTEVYYSSELVPRISEPPLARFIGILGIAAFYTSDDKTRHVIVVTADGNITEVYYSSELAPRISEPPIGTFAADPPTLEDISPDVANLDSNAAKAVDQGSVSTAGRSVSIAGVEGALFVFNEKAGVWSNTGSTSWVQLAKSPLQATLFPPSSLAVDPNNVGVVVAATDEGAFESTDGGATWSLIVQTWSCGSTAIRAAIYANDSSLVLATDCGIATRPVGKPFTFVSTVGQRVSALAKAETTLWARVGSSLWVSTDNGTKWTTALNNSAALSSFDLPTLAAFDDFVYLASSTKGLGSCGTGNVIGIYNVSTGLFKTQPVTANGVQTCDGTGLGGRKFIKSFVLKDASLADSVGPSGRRQLFFGSGQEVYQALASDSTGAVTDWQLIVATGESGAKTIAGKIPPMVIHADIWDFNIDTNVGATKAWVAGDGGVYRITLENAFVFPESDGWIKLFGEMHTHQAHMITVVPINPINRSALAYPTGDNEGWYRKASMLVEPPAKWEETYQISVGNLGDVNWSVADSSAPRFFFLVRNQETAAFVDRSLAPDIKFVTLLNFWKKKDYQGNLQLADGHFFPGGVTAFQFIQSPKNAGRFNTLDAVMMCDLPLIKYNAATDSNDVMLPNSSLGRSTNGAPVLLRNRQFDSNVDINISDANGWAIEIASFPAQTLGFYVAGPRSGPTYYSFTSSTLSRLDGSSWTQIATDVNPSAAFGPAFVNPYENGVSTRSLQRGSKFQPTVADCSRPRRNSRPSSPDRTTCRCRRWHKSLSTMTIRRRSLPVRRAECFTATAAAIGSTLRLFSHNHSVSSRASESILKPFTFPSILAALCGLSDTVMLQGDPVTAGIQ